MTEMCEPAGQSAGGGRPTHSNVYSDPLRLATIFTITTIRGAEGWAVSNVTDMCAPFALMGNTPGPSGHRLPDPRSTLLGTALVLSGVVVDGG